MNTIKTFIFLLATSLGLAGCGSDSGGTIIGTPGGGGGTGGSSVASVTVTSDVQTIPADGSGSATITALVRDANNNAMTGVVVTFSTPSGTLVVSRGTTDSTGTAVATLSAGGIAVGTQIIVTASAGSASDNTTVTVASTQQTITLLTNSPQIPSDGSRPATITAVVRDANNQLLPGVTIGFGASSGGIAAIQTQTTVTPGVTDSNGSAAASLTTAGDKTNRTITVTASIGANSVQITVDVVGTKITVTGPASLVQGSQGTYNVSLTDSANNGIGSQAVSVTSSLGNTLSSASLTTDNTGHATFTMIAVNAGTDTLSATALGLTGTQSVTINNQSFAFTAPAANALVNLGASQTVSVVWTTGGTPQAGQTISFSTTRGSFGGNPTTTAVTDGTGTATVTTSSATAGPAVITATATGVSAQVSFIFVATNPASIAVQASPATIPIQGRSTISAIVRDAQNNLVQGKTVTFQLTDITGGSLSVGSATTDSQGLAQTVYTASTTPSSSNGVTINATVQGMAISQTVTLTVGGQAVFLSLGTGEVLGENATHTQFILPYVVQAQDAAGNAVPNVTITLTLHSMPRQTAQYAYRKGQWNQGTAAWIPVETVSCFNEDANLNGILDPGEDASGNSNGKLDPGDIASVGTTPVTTDATGSATFNVFYPESYAHWVQVQLTATATVQGTQSSTSVTFWLPNLASYVNNIANDIPGRYSPYGVDSTCSDSN